MQCAYGHARSRSYRAHVVYRSRACRARAASRAVSRGLRLTTIGTGGGSSSSSCRIHGAVAVRGQAYRRHRIPAERRTRECGRNSAVLRVEDARGVPQRPLVVAPAVGEGARHHHELQLVEAVARLLTGAASASWQSVSWLRKLRGRSPAKARKGCRQRTARPSASSTRLLSCCAVGSPAGKCRRSHIVARARDAIAARMARARCAAIAKKINSERPLAEDVGPPAG
eukprot:scaffold131419_cov63-Phaeocystis_antarctica.AAC.5